jgi:hypothetical protein
MEVNDPDNLDLTIKNNNRFEKEFRVIFSLGDPSEDVFVCKIIIRISPEENNGTIEFYDDKDEVIKSKSLVVKRYPTQTALYY